MNFTDAHAAVQDAKRTISATDDIAGKLADLLVGRLRKVSSGWVLEQLKRELRDFNMHTKTWKSK